MFIRITHAQNAWISFAEFALYLPLTACIVHRFLNFLKTPSWKTNKTLRFLWYAQLVLIINLLNTALILMIYGLLPKGRFMDIVGCVRHVLGQAWFFLFATIQLLLILLVSGTVLNCQRKSTRSLKNYYYGFLIPLLTYMLNIPHLFSHGKPPIVPERYSYLLSNTGAILVVLMSLFCTFWLAREFKKLTEEINKHEYARIKNKENIRRWKIYLVANIVIAIGIFLYCAVDNIDELFEIGFLSVYDYDTKEDGHMPYVLSRFINTVLKLILSCILVFLSPYTSLKVKSKRKLQIIRKSKSTKSNKRRESNITSFESTISK
eukprot:GAHX01002767.1.p1 GENE.GAHX01002767.1~~GAHX01002767.1.p1  ORF type:complete len:332 (+),score=23.50 GAHX01002767.1:39-998(+)